MAFKKVEPTPNLKNAPVQYQRGWTEFYKLRFDLTQDVLIPRPETELLVDEVIRFRNSELGIQNVENKNNSELSTQNSSCVIMDIGTGSGCIAISIAKNLPNVRVIATDISKEALQVAEKNSLKHKTDKKIIFLHQDLLGNLKVSPDIIVTNLPYIPYYRLSMIDPLVRDFEPKIALDGGSDGFDLYRKLFSQMNEKQISPKILIAEIDESQAENAPLEAKKAFPKASKIEIKKDLFGKNRILIIEF